MSGTLAGLMRLAAGLAMAVAVSGDPASAQTAPAAGDCRCPTVQAHSTPSNPSNVCSKGEVAGSCSLKWNVSSQATKPFTAALAVLKDRAARVAPPPSPACVQNPSVACPWVEFLRADGDYARSPETAGIGFLLLLATSMAALPDPGGTLQRAVLNEAERANALGLVLANGGNWNARGERYQLRAAFGCLRADVTEPRATFVVQNSRSRIENTCQ